VNGTYLANFRKKLKERNNKISFFTMLRKTLSLSLRFSVRHFFKIRCLTRSPILAKYNNFSLEKLLGGVGWINKRENNKSITLYTLIFPIRRFKNFFSNLANFACIELLTYPKVRYLGSENERILAK
jgi:hypothetical protein